MMNYTNSYNFTSLVKLMKKEKIWDCRIEFIIIKANEVISTKTKDAEFIIVIKGSGGVIIKGESKLIKTGDVIYVSENSLRSIANINYNELLEVICIIPNN